MLWRVCRSAAAAWRRPLSRPLSQLPAVDQDVHGFRVRQVRELPELSASAALLEHQTSGAQYLHVARDDPDNVFSIGFPTTPQDSSGVAHILEHTTLCGSRRFPARDPFFKMLNRSLATFMNAFTASDWTMYPFSTCNEADYMNLLAIYMDAVFEPRLERLDFLQEGWRLEHENPEDPSSPIVFKGVVFNEMKGALSDRHRVFAERVQNALLPSHTYRHCSGGDPLHIPELTWEQLKQFHATHYHPRNCRIFSYGNLPLEPRLKFLHEQYLSRAPAVAASDTRVPLEPRWDAPRREQLKCRYDPLSPRTDRQASVAVSLLVGDVTDSYESLLMTVLSELLVDGPSSPFYQALVESGLGDDYTPHVTGFDNSCRETVFSVGLQGVADADTDKVVEIIDKTLAEVAEKGFEQERVDAVLHRLELGRKHQSNHFGLGLVMQVVAPWFHGGDPLDALSLDTHLARLRREMADNPRLLQERLARLLRDNRHRLVTVMTPDLALETELQKKEADMLAGRVAALSDADRQRVLEDGRLLQEKQAAGDDASSLPMLDVRRDIAPHAPRAEVRRETVSATPVQVSEQPTNGITYFRAVVDTSGVPAYFRPLLPLFCRLVTSMGAGQLDYRQQDQQQQLWTGGLSAAVTVTDHPSEPGRYEEGMLLTSYCLEQNAERMFGLWEDIFTGVTFENRERLSSQLQMSAAELANSVPHAGHQYAMSSAAAGLTGSAQLRQLYSGLDQVRYVRQLVTDGELDMTVTKLKMLAEMLLMKDGMRCALNGTAAGLPTALAGLESLLVRALGEGRAESWVQPEFAPAGCQTYVELPMPVHYAARCVPTVPYAHPDFAALRVLARLLSLGHLHREIREKGGAYGGGAVASPAGLWSYYSYRDPSSLATLRVFDGAVQVARERDFSPEEVDGAKLGVFQAVDAPVVPAQRGMRHFLHGITDDQFDEHRSRLQAVTRDDLRRVAETYLARPAVTGTCILGKQCPDLDSSWQVQQS
ncbi:presequence protease, mitochondrial-like isoform X1 [Amphibalanus amphitrite]|uniref:presequence protease, mitochondrial-like isoform X1 n=1 Tax=Amphibalanus amphitrite TaxID=1232801 RepID=UPI001C8FC125|nr:presequence protease, mitochondrial-like isoform X1 [Amphibalanus amphitrite]XP_043239225.1 presequence protease, mitochondrial-like isoform X1 [Amphibalanus amphitrite]XP_043239226.1 presequence protease, mitochondrial-like isoform X1 [Amphibalanus amphitrite]XP_043239227.1 presequence protease, mitochondrial-like isoform X1 [Amphibalanus amphitrite]